MALLGRAGECATLREFLSAAHGDPGGTLVVVGEPGIGKTALVEHVVPAAAIRVAGVEAETGFPYAVLHRLLIPYLNAVDRPGGSRAPGGLRVALGLAERLRVVLGLADRPPAGPVPVARAAAALLTAAGPVTCVVDDAQWADDASLDALARCAGAPGLGLILVTRGIGDRLAGLPVLEVGGLGAADGIALLRPAAGRPLDHVVATRLVAAAGGNPRALIELGRELSTGRALVGGRLAGYHLRGLPGLPPAVWRSAVDRDARPDETAAAGLARIAAAGADAARAGQPDQAAFTSRDAGRADQPDQAAFTSGCAARADLLTRAAELSRDPTDRARRMLDAADAALDAGAPHQARELAGAAERESPGVLTVRGRARIVRAGAAAMLGGGHADGLAGCLDAATVPGLVHEALLRAVEHLLRAVAPPSAAGIARVAAAVAALAPGHGEDVRDQQLRAFAALAGGDPGTAVAGIRRAAELLLDPAVPDEVVVRDHLTAAVTSVLLWDAGLHRALWRRVTDAARRTGAHWRLLVALHGAATVEVRLGDLDRAGELLAEADRIRARLGGIGAVITDGAGRPELNAGRSGPADGIVVALGRGDYAQARAAGRDITDADVLGLHSGALPDLIEAAVRSDDRELATRALATLTGRAEAAGTGWALGVLARSRALLAGPGTAEPLYREAITLLDGSAARGEPVRAHLLDGSAARADLARAHLLYGEWLRRRKRRRDARAELRIAGDLFTGMGAAGFAARAAQELTATGPTTRRTGGLTPQELAIANLAAGGATNSEIAAQLFLSANTVGHHLRQVFRKLDVSSRRRLSSALPGSETLVNALEREDE